LQARPSLGFFLTGGQISLEGE